MEYTKKERRAIVRAFKAAKKYLWNGEDWGLTAKNLKNKGICDAIYEARDRGECTTREADRAQTLIMGRLSPSVFVHGWLNRKGYPTDDSLAVQQYRHLWLDSLIKEFSK